MKSVILNKEQIDRLRNKILSEASYSELLSDAQEGDEVHVVLKDGTDIVLNVERVQQSRMVTSHDGSVIKMSENQKIVIPSNPFNQEKGTLEVAYVNAESGEVMGSSPIKGVESVYLTRNGETVTELGKDEDEKEAEEEPSDEEEERKKHFKEDIIEASKGDRITIVTGEVKEKPGSKEGDEWNEQGRIKLNVVGEISEDTYTTTIQSLEGEYENSSLSKAQTITIGTDSFKLPKEEGSDTYRLALKYKTDEGENTHIVQDVITTFVEKEKATEPEQPEDSETLSKAQIEKLKKDPEFLEILKKQKDIEKSIQTFKGKTSSKKKKKTKEFEKLKNNASVLFRTLTASFGDEDIQLEKDDTEIGLYNKRQNVLVIRNNESKKKDKRIVLKMRKNEDDVFDVIMELREGKDVVKRKGDAKIRILDYDYK